MKDNICKADPFPPTPPTDSSSPKLQPEMDTASQNDYQKSLELSEVNSAPYSQSLNYGEKLGLSTLDSAVKLGKLIAKSKENDSSSKEMSEFMNSTEVKTPAESNMPSTKPIWPMPDEENEGSGMYETYFHKM